MTIDELIKEMEEEYAVFLEGTGLDNQQRMEEERKNNPDCNRVCTANEMMLDILRKYQKIFNKFEILTASFKDSDSPEVRSKKVDEFCIETMRGLLGEYYAERMAEDGNDD